LATFPAVRRARTALDRIVVDHLGDCGQSLTTGEYEGTCEHGPGTGILVVATIGTKSAPGERVRPQAGRGGGPPWGRWLDRWCRDWITHAGGGRCPSRSGEGGLTLDSRCVGWRKPDARRLCLRARRCPAGLGLDQAAADCVSGEVDAVAHAESLQDVGAVSFDGFDAEHEQLGDLL
jgi:hypothetical protein